MITAEQARLTVAQQANGQDLDNVMSKIKDAIRIGQTHVNLKKDEIGTPVITFLKTLGYDFYRTVGINQPIYDVVSWG